ncbi:MAG: MFS transporter [Bdellovibrionota bacterium]|nr:MFS transporter [Bdellovibrionota bacterium]
MIHTEFEGAPQFNKNKVLIGLSLSVFMASMNNSIANISLPVLRETFETSVKEIQWVVIVYLLATTVFALTIGKLGDIFDRKLMLKVGIVIFFISSALCALSPNHIYLIAFRSLQGFGAAFLVVLSMVLFSETLPKNSTGIAMGLFGTISSVGTAAGPPLGGLLIDSLGWEYIFLVNLPLAALSFYLILEIPQTNNVKRILSLKEFDFKGFFYLTLLLASYSVSMTFIRNEGEKLGFIFLILSCVFLFLFISIEKSSKSPLVNLNFLSRSSLSKNLVMNFLVTANQMGSLVIGPFYLTISLHLSILEAGVVMSTGSITAAAFGIIGGKLVDKFGGRQILLLAISIILTSSLMFSFLPVSFGLLGYICTLLTLTMGYATFLAANNTLSMKSMDKEARGTISGFMNLSRNLGLLTGASFLGAIFALFSTQSNQLIYTPESILHGFNFTFRFGSFLIFICLLVGVSFVKKRWVYPILRNCRFSLDYCFYKAPLASKKESNKKGRSEVANKSNL